MAMTVAVMMFPMRVIVVAVVLFFMAMAMSVVMFLFATMAVSVMMLSMGVAVDVLVEMLLLRGCVRDDALHGRGWEQGRGL